MESASVGGQEEGGVLCRVSSSSYCSGRGRHEGVVEKADGSDHVGNEGSGLAFRQLWCKQDTGWNDVC